MKLELKNITKNYENKLIFEDICISFKTGGVNAVFGRSGSGKSTILNLIAGIEYPSSGEILVNENILKYENTKEMQNYRRNNIGFIFQEFNLDLKLTVWENVMSIANIKKQNRKDVEDRANSLLKELEIEQYKDLIASKLSGGQKQRCAIVRALINQPTILLADEPTGNLDEETGRQIIEVLQKIAQDTLVIVVTHSEVIKEVATTLYEFNNYSIEVHNKNEKYQKEKQFNLKKGSSSIINTLQTVIYNFRRQKIKNILIIALVFIATITSLVGLSGKEAYSENSNTIINTEGMKTRILDVANPLDPKMTGDPNDFQLRTLSSSQKNKISSIEHVDKINIGYSYFHVTQFFQDKLFTETEGGVANYKIDVENKINDTSVEFLGKTFLEDELPITVEKQLHESVVEFSGKSMNELLNINEMIEGDFLITDKMHSLVISETLANVLAGTNDFSSLLNKEVTFYFNVPIYSRYQIIEAINGDGELYEMPMIFPVYKRVPVSLNISGVYKSSISGKHGATTDKNQIMISSELIEKLVDENRKVDNFNEKEVESIPTEYNHIVVDSFENVSYVIKKLSEDEPNLLVRGYAVISETIKQSTGAITKFLLLLGLLLLVVVIIIVYVIAYINYLQRRKQYGIYQAFGVTKYQLYLLTTGELILSTLFGLIGGISVTRLISGSIAKLIFTNDRGITTVFEVTQLSIVIVVIIFLSSIITIGLVITIKIIKTKIMLLLK